MDAMMCHSLESGPYIPVTSACSAEHMSKKLSPHSFRTTAPRNTAGNR
ncbi:sodium stibogluconate resistance protein, putative [Leishmania tarentolae]|uniref:Sodium stibogluconate resistance protein, putative n=1 Tax=Leishmania tarentolae TaxID=5689 RepID=A0A640L225_LEITA|nr:sodium stibogluconate resistance protein, putative [Leishmania tarentolae]